MKLKMFYTIAIVSIILFLSACGSSNANEKPTKEFVKAQTFKAVSEWRQLKYGMFIHFGMSTYTGHELDLGDQPSATYAPTCC